LIPKVIHYCWLSGDPFPELVERCITTWKEKLPDYKLVLWDTARLASEFQGLSGEEISRIGTNFTKEEYNGTGGNLWLRQTIQNRKYAFAADYLRVYALYQYGGIYLDSDVEVTGSFDPFLKHALFTGFDYHNDLEPAIIGAIAGHPWIKAMLGYYENRSFIRKEGNFDMRPLPTVFNQNAKQLFKYEQNGKFQFIKNQGVTIYPYEYFSPKNVYFNKIKRTKNTVAIHHFHGGWVEKNLGYKLKRIAHQILFTLGGKSFHDQIIYYWRGKANYNKAHYTN